MASDEQAKFFMETVETAFAGFKDIQPYAASNEIILGGLRLCRGMDYAPWEGEMVRKIVPLEEIFGLDARGLEFAVHDSREDTIFECLAPHIGHVAFLGGAAETGTWRELDDYEAQLLVDWLQNPRGVDTQTTLKGLRKMSAKEAADKAMSQEAAVNSTYRGAQDQATVRYARGIRNEFRRRHRRLAG